MMEAIEADAEGRKGAIELHFSPYLRGCIRASAAISGLSVEDWIKKVLKTEIATKHLNSIEKVSTDNQWRDVFKKEMEETKPIMHGRCPLCGAKMFYTADASLVLEDGSYKRLCICENGHEFIERTTIGVKG